MPMSVILLLAEVAPSLLVSTYKVRCLQTFEHVSACQAIKIQARIQGGVEGVPPLSARGPDEPRSLL